MEKELKEKDKQINSYVDISTKIEYNEKSIEELVTNKDGYKIYRAKESDCDKCQLKDKCTKMNAKIITRHI